MAKVALVLSGGGAKGAFQFMAEKYAREVKGYKWDIIAGVSVGALNGVMLAMKKYQRLEEIWKTILNKRVYTGRLNLWSIIRLIFGAKSIYSNRPLWKIIDREVELEKIKEVDLRIGAVSLWTGEYKLFKTQDQNFKEEFKEVDLKKVVLASTVMPIIWAPVDISSSLKGMVDGGLRNISPLGDVLDADPEEVIIINCNPTQPPKMNKPFKNILDIGKRSLLEIALNEIFVTDIREFIRINRNVQEAAENELTLHNERGKPFKHYKYKIIEPDKPLDDTLDFSREAIERSMKAGWERAEKVLG